MILISGYHTLTGEKDYRSTKPSMSAPVFSRVMRRNGFQEINQCFHLADNENLTESKTAKVDPIYDELLKNCQQFGMFDKLLSIGIAWFPIAGIFQYNNISEINPYVLDTNSDFIVEQAGIPIILSCIKKNFFFIKKMLSIIRPCSKKS